MKAAGLDPARVLNPQRPRLDAARAAVAGVVDAAEAWERLAARGVIPLAWANDPARRFGDPLVEIGVRPWPTSADVADVEEIEVRARGASRQRYRVRRRFDPARRAAGAAAAFRDEVDAICADPAADAVLAHPPTIPAGLAFASDPAGIATA